MAANKRVPSRRPKSVKDLTHEPASAKKTRLADRTKSIEKEIHHLECIITAAPRLARQRRLARINMVPPPERETAADRMRDVKHLPLQHQIAIRRKRLLLATELGVVGVAIVGIAGWLNQFLHIYR